jgi:hypothetical protein
VDAIVAVQLVSKLLFDKKTTHFFTVKRNVVALYYGGTDKLAPTKTQDVPPTQRPLAGVSLLHNGHKQGGPGRFS